MQTPVAAVPGVAHLVPSVAPLAHTNETIASLSPQRTVSLPVTRPKAGAGPGSPFGPEGPEAPSTANPMSGRIVRRQAAASPGRRRGTSASLSISTDDRDQYVGSAEPIVCIDLAELQNLVRSAALLEPRSYLCWPGHSLTPVRVCDWTDAESVYIAAILGLHQKPAEKRIAAILHAVEALI